MAILEINLEKPALIEKYQYPDETDEYAGHTGVKSTNRRARSKSSNRRTRSKSSGGSKGKLLGLLVLLAGVGVAAWKLKGGGGTEQTEFDEFDDDEEYEHGPDPEIGGDKKYEVKRKVKSKVSGTLGLAVAAVALAVLAWKRRG